MRLSRRASWFLIAFCLWTWFIWVTLVKNIWADSRSWNHGATAFFVVHVVLAVIDIVCGTAIGRLGWRGLKAHRVAQGQVKESERAAERRAEKV